MGQLKTTCDDANLYFFQTDSMTPGWTQMNRIIPLNHMYLPISYGLCLRSVIKTTSKSIPYVPIVFKHDFLFMLVLL